MLNFEIEDELKWIKERLKADYQIFGEKFPTENTFEQNYKEGKNDEWTSGFWVGMYWLMYENTNEREYYEIALNLTDMMIKRLEDDWYLEHHDIGFLYSLSVVAAYNNTQDKKYLKYIQIAADKLISRFQNVGQFIQCWGKLGDPKQYRLIIDSLMNMPLLYTASKLLNEEKYKTIADTHYQAVFDNVVRSDNTTYHTYYFDPKTGDPVRGVTAQGNSNDSCWSRGQAWSIAGIAFNHQYNETNQDDLFDKLLKVFVDNIPSDGVVYWDFDFDDDNPSARDSSANAIVACGLLEQSKYVEPQKAECYKQLAIRLIEGIQNNYTNKCLDVNSFVTGGTYGFPMNRGINEGNLWGDYFYLEALTRLNLKNWHKYW